MAARDNNIGPISLSVLLHVLLFASMGMAFNFARPAPITPMAIQATLIVDTDVLELPPVADEDPEPVVEVEEPEPEVIEPEPEPEPEEVEPEPVVEEPDNNNSEELRRQAEEEKRIEDALIEKERIEKIRLQEEADKREREKEEQDRKKREEEEKERQRVEAERKRKEDAERQREENERLRRELESEQRAQEIEDEARRLAARNSPAMDAYVFAISQRISQKWSAPASADEETLCSVRVTQDPGGYITGVNILSCNGDDAVRRSVEAAIRNSSPLPRPSDPALFERNLTVNLRLARDD